MPTGYICCAYYLLYLTNYSLYCLELTGQPCTVYTLYLSPIVLWRAELYRIADTGHVWGTPML